jgi:hypothetical protein
MDGFGILYVATGPPCLEEATRSAASVRAYMPDVPTAIFTDEPQAVSPAHFNLILPLANATRTSYDKIGGLARTPFERTLFLDSDTLLLAPVYELPPLLDSFELAYCHAPTRFGPYDYPGCNEAFPQGNSGVILYRNTERLKALFTVWDKLYQEESAHRHRAGIVGMVDQPSFRQALFSSDLRFTILTPEYNLRTPTPYFAGGRAMVKILHGREPEISKAAAEVNATLLPRIGNVGAL